MLYIMRHGRTDWNSERRMQGRTDIPLNENGRGMAREARRKYSDIHFDICYCSPLVRAKETCEILLEGRDIPVVFDERLVEMCFGEAEGKIIDFDDEENPVYNFFNAPEKYTNVPCGAGTFEELFARTGAFLKDTVFPLVEDGKDVLIVGHGAMNSSIICQVWNLPLEKFWSAGRENCALKQLIPADVERIL